MGLQHEGEDLEEAKKNEEIAASIQGPVIGRGLKGDEVLYTVIPGSQFDEILATLDLTAGEKELLEEIRQIRETAQGGENGPKAP